MPQNEEFWNPYRMIPVKDVTDRRPPLTDEKFKGRSGMISCSLSNLTPLFIGGSRFFRENFLTRNGKLVIPGSSLKGMLRSLAEIVGGGCAVTDSRGMYNKTYKACDRAHQLCIACRMFGMMERGRNARVHRGNISIGDALLRGDDKPEMKTFQVLLANCGTRHEPFYRTPGTGRLDGKSRKFYFHQPLRTDSVPVVPDNLRSRAWNIRALPPGHCFEFEVQFSNLRQAELGLLLYVLALEGNVQARIGDSQQTLKGPLRHKIGNAKPLGLGSCHIAIERIAYFADPGVRFTSLRNTGDDVYEGKRLEGEIRGQTQSHAQDRSETMTQLRKMMVWDESDKRNFRYPDYPWFKSPANSQKPLKQI